MRPSRRRAVAGYIEVFVLVGVALGGSAVVYGATSVYGSSLRSAAVSIVSASVSQGSYLAVERIALFNDGQVTSASMTISTPQAPQAATYCYSVASPSTMAVISSTCPSSTPDPRSVTIAYALPPGGSVLVEVFVQGARFNIGSSLIVIVTTSSGAQDSAGVQVLPA